MPYKDPKVRLAKHREAYLRAKKEDPEKIRRRAREATRRWRERKLAGIGPIPKGPAPRTKDWQWKINLSRYGITPEEYGTLAHRQDGKCAVCRKPETATVRGRPRRLSVDHRHSDGKIRGLLCMNCNRGIGNFKDDPRIALMAVGYLRKHAG
jgi:hypothetical protein